MHQWSNTDMRHRVQVLVRRTGNTIGTITTAICAALRLIESECEPHGRREGEVEGYVMPHVRFNYCTREKHKRGKKSKANT